MVDSMQSSKLPDLMTRKEVADVLRVSLMTTYAMQHRGALKPLKLGTKLVRFRRHDLHQLLGGEQ